MKFLTLLFILMFYRIRTSYGWPTNLGCFRDDFDRALPYYAGNSIQILTECIGKCREQRMRYAGVHLGHQCYCGNDWPKYGLSSNPCNYNCTGGEACGGHTWAMNVYTVCQNESYWDSTETSCVQCSGHCLLDPVCHQGKGDCKDWKCKPGWKSANCNIECDDGRYGLECAKLCGKCLNGLCNKETGECPNGECQQGYQGPMCQEQQCSDGQYGPECKACGQCIDGESCDKTTGVCYNGCKDGYRASLCQECTDAKYGDDCQYNCGYCINNERCDKDTGDCSQCANDKYQAPKCIECKPKTYSSTCQACGQCKDDQSCDTTTGECNNGCKHGGYKGPMCQECLAGYYGNDCSTCGHCLSPPCDMNTGQCSDGCQSGYTGNLCNTECADGRHGKDCQESCGHCVNPTCDKETGQCDSQRCQAGYQGTHCNTECPRGKYGKNCESVCGNCQTQPCDTQTGICANGQCQAGSKGDTCETACDGGKYGPNCKESCAHCINPVCDKGSGQCDSQGCKAGYKGNLCETECDTGFYGENCAMTCGQCLISPCDRTSGICPNGECKEDYKGLLCKNKNCEDGKYGPPDCDKDCGHCKELSCNEVTGVCDNGCELGYQGKTCDSECADGFYGDCTQSCGQCRGEVCDKVTGLCSDEGCKDGWKGNECRQQVMTTVTPKIIDTSTQETGAIVQNNPPMSAIGGAIGALLVIIIIVVVVVLLVKRRRQPRKEDEGDLENDRSTLATTPLSTNHYGNVRETNGSLKGASALEMAPKENKPKKIENINMKQDTPEKPPTSPKLVMPSTSGGQEDIYENMSKLLKVEEIEGYVKDMKATEDGFENEFRKIPSDKLAAWTIASNPSLKPKNRFKNIWPYDHSRVHLKETPGVAGSDYINACHIGGYKSPRKYIATQGPMDRTVNDFWRMIWEQSVTRIVMVANIYEDTKKKCEMYWPDYGKTETHGKFTVKNTKEENFKGFIVRTMKLSMEQGSSDAGAIYNNEAGTTRTVIQFHFTDWPDKGVPLYCTALVSFHRKVKAMSEKVNSPIVVHCSAGIGRTGTYIALDNLTDQCHAEGVVDVFQCVVNLRKDRFNMVQTKHQYIFLYETLFESLTTGVTLIPCFKFSETYEQLQKPEKGKTTTGLDAQYKIVKAHIQKVLKDRSLEGALDPENESKNRSQETLPGDSMRVNVMLDEPGRNRYINAVFAENYFKRNGLHLTQLPLADTVIDFWRMVQGYNVNTIVSLSNPQEDPFKTSKFWPAGTADKVISGPFTITRKEMSQQGTVDCCHLVLAYKNEERNVFLVSVSNWADDKWVPNDINTMYDIHNSVQTWQQGHTSEGQTVIQCYDGGMKSGMYAVVSWMFDMINSEQEVDIFQITKQILLARPGFLTKMEQYKDLYKIAQDYMDKFQNYSNFK